MAQIITTLSSVSCYALTK